MIHQGYIVLWQLNVSVISGDGCLNILHNMAISLCMRCHIACLPIMWHNLTLLRTLSSFCIDYLYFYCCRFPAGFVPTSNGIISPNLPNFPRPSSSSLPQNMQRGEIIYPIQYLPPNSARAPNYQQGPPPPLVQVPPNYQPPHPQPFYTTTLAATVGPFGNKRPPQCTNCGAIGHTGSECPEPGDTSASVSKYCLQCQPLMSILCTLWSWNDLE